MKSLIDIEMERRKTQKPSFIGKAKQIGKGVGYFLGGAAKGFSGLVKEGAGFVGREIKAEVKTEFEARKAFIDARRKAKIEMARKAAYSKYGLTPIKKQKTVIKKPKKQRKIIIFR